MISNQISIGREEANVMMSNTQYIQAFNSVTTGIALVLKLMAKSCSAQKKNWLNAASAAYWRKGKRLW